MSISKKTRQIISSGSSLEPIIGFSRAVRVGNQIFIAGTAPIPKLSNEKTPLTVYGQTKLCFEIAKEAIEQAGGNLTDVVRTRIMLTDISKWEEAGKVHGEYFSEIRPVCTFVEVKGFIKPEWLVEIEVDCIISD
jgi:enamine deaminase RidA (YjgF/YER057c/UK114 family)